MLSAWSAHVARNKKYKKNWNKQTPT